MEERVPKVILKNSVYLLGAEAIKNGSLFILSVLIARSLGAEQYGRLAWAIVFAGMAAPLADFGLGTILIREIAKKKTRIQEQLETSLALKIILGVFAAALLFLSAEFLVAEISLRLLVLTAGLWLILETGITFFQAVFRGAEKMEYETLFQAFYSLLLLIGAGSAILSSGSLQTILSGYLLAVLLTLIAISIFVQKKFFPFRLKINLTELKYLLKSGGLVFLATMIFVLYTRTDVLLLGWLKSLREVGLYSAVYSFIFGFKILSIVLTNALYPRLSKTGAGEAGKAFRWGNLAILTMTIPLFLTIYILRQSLLEYLYGAEFVKAELVVLPLGIAFVIQSLAHLNYFSLYAKEREKTIMMVTGLGLGINAALNLALIPQYSYVGSAYAALITEALLLGTLIFLNRDVYCPVPLKPGSTINYDSRQ